MAQQKSEVLQLKFPRSSKASGGFFVSVLMSALHEIIQP